MNLENTNINTENWFIREGNINDVDGILALYKTVFDKEISKEVYIKKFFENPDGNPIVAVACSNESIVGQYALWPTNLIIKGNEIKAAQSLDTMTHPDFRGKGMFTKLANECMRYAKMQNIEVLYGFANSNSLPGFKNNLDWVHLADGEFWFRPVCINKYNNEHYFKHKVLFYIFKLLASFAVIFLPKGRRNKKFVFKKNKPEYDELKQLLSDYDNLNQQNKINWTPDRIYWRHNYKTNLAYNYLSIYKNNKLQSLVIYGIDENTNNIVISKFISLDDKTNSILLREIIRIAKKKGSPFIFIAGININIKTKTLLTSGFFKRKSTFFIIRKLTNRSIGNGIYDKKKWFLFGSDIDTF